MDKKLLPRHAAGSFELHGGTGGITGMCSCGEFLEMYKVDKTYRVQSPERIDPDQTNPNAMWVITPISDVGSRSPIVSRILLQGSEILKAAWFEREIEKDEVISLLHACKEDLLVCDQIAKRISTEVSKIMLKVQTEGITSEKGRALNPFPHVQNLTNECDNFLIKAKRVIKHICTLPFIFFELPREDNNFEHLFISLSSVLDNDHLFLKDFIIPNTPYIKHIIELRNFQEHPKKHKKTIIENFKLTVDNKNIVVPQWNITGEEPCSITEEMEAIVNFLLEVAEIMFINVVMNSVKKEIPFVIERVPDADINLDAPIKFNLSIDLNVSAKPTPSTQGQRINSNYVVLKTKE
ncbi:hypothetical protein [Legionella drancourtii]|uniref:Uncharacterized protein n=1 Tax=Legionella drancourtii LLAP12 TaxID=658187 RepID=G9ELF3_9GAMM|nr:hypothetical protein [Legionella drancourtii]EHL31788.1 hypothetical protein LDG_5951 [Legionella drancourtii LLAP12]